MVRSALFCCLIATPLLAGPTYDDAIAASKRHAGSHDRLSLQYMGAAAASPLAVAPFSLRYQTALARYREGSLDNLGWTAADLFHMRLAPGELSKALSLSFRVMRDRGEDTLIVQLFRRYRTRSVFTSLDDEGTQVLSSALDKTGDQAAASLLWERLIEHYPITPESRWAMAKLEGTECRGKPYAYRLDVLRRVSRNATVDPGLATWLAAILDRPVRPLRGGVVLLGSVDKLEAMQYLRLYEQAATYGEELVPSLTNQPDVIRALKVVGDAYSALGKHSIAIIYYGRADVIAHGADRDLRESYASALTKTGNFMLAASLYESLKGRRNNTHYAWQVFWNRYRSGDHLSSFDVLKTLPVHGSRDPYLRDAALYWKGRVLTKLGRDVEAKHQWSQLSKGPLPFYRTMALPGEGRERGAIRSIPQALRDTIKAASVRFVIDPMLVMSVIQAESRFRAESVSHVGARGMMQLMPYTAVRIAKLIEDYDFTLSRLSEPETNIVYGAYYLKLLLNFYDGNVGLTVAAYNAGPRAVNTWLRACLTCSFDEFVETITYPETKKYVREVLGNYSRSSELRGADKVALMAPSLPRTVKDESTIF